MSIKHESCELCGDALPEVGRRRIQAQWEYRRGEWTSEGWTLYVCGSCLGKLRAELGGKEDGR